MWAQEPTPRFSRTSVAAAGEIDLAALMALKDRGEWGVAMSEAALGSSAMRGAVGFPKVMVSTLASGNTAHYVGSSDITMIPRIVDVFDFNMPD